MNREDIEACTPPLCLVGKTVWGEEWTAEGVIAALEPLVSELRRERLQRVIAGRLESVTLLMDAPHDPHNGAAVMRSCDAFGVQELHVVARRERFLIARRVTQGAERWVDAITYQTAKEAISTLQARGFELIAGHARGELVPGDLRKIERLALVVGNEHDGICEALNRAARRSVRIPMRGFVESLNVSVSAAVLLAAATRDRAGDLSARQKQLLYARWLHHSLPRATDILLATPPR